MLLYLIWAFLIGSFTLMIGVMVYNEWFAPQTDGAATIESAASFPAKTSALCGWCDYREICPEWDGGGPARPEAGPAAAPPGPSPDLEPGTDQYLLFGGPVAE